MAYLVFKRFLVCHGLEGKDPSDDQYGINHFLVVAFEVIPQMNTSTLVILLARSLIRVILSAGLSHKWVTWVGVSQRCLRPGCST